MFWSDGAVDTSFWRYFDVSNSSKDVMRGGRFYPMNSVSKYSSNKKVSLNNYYRYERIKTMCFLGQTAMFDGSVLPILYSLGAS